MVSIQMKAMSRRICATILTLLSLYACAKDIIPSGREPQDQVYFGYGTNLNSAFMKERLKDGAWVDDWHKSGNNPDPLPVDLGCHRLDGFEFGYTFNTEPFGEPGAAANVAPKAGALTYGVVYHLTKTQLNEVDTTEDTPVAYERIELSVQPCSSPVFSAASISAWVYVGQKAYLTDKLKPDPAYVKILLDGAEEHKLPKDYIEKYLKVD